MKDQINAFLIGAKNTFENPLLGFTVSTGKPSLSVNPVTSDEVSVLVGISGDVSGNLVMSMKHDVVRTIVGKMYGGAEIQELGDMEWSAFSEFANWVGGACCTECAKRNYSVDITPPIINEGSSKSRSVDKFISIPFAVDGKEIMMHISLKNTQ